MRIFTALLLLLALAPTAMAAEPPPLVPPPEGAPIALTYIYYALSALVPIVLVWIKLRIDRSDKTEAEKKAEKEAIETLHDGVSATYLAYVKAAKLDGSFDPEMARTEAVETAREMVGPAARAVYEAWGKEKLRTLVHRIADKLAGKKAKPLPAPGDSP